MNIQTRDIDYECDGVVLQAHMAFDADITGPRPVVLCGHAWSGRSEFENAKAVALAELGYVGFAWDVYGKGKLGSNADENRAMMEPLLGDRAQLQKRLLAAVDIAGTQAESDASKIAAIGFCFGGLCALDLARTGKDLAGVVSFHGLFHPAENLAGTKINAKVLALHGWDDPMATPENVVAFAQEMSAVGADWQLHGYGNTLHAFTNPGANDPAFGTVYDANADRRSWLAMSNFLAEVF